MEAGDSVGWGRWGREEYREGQQENEQRGMTLVGHRHRNGLLPVDDNMYSILNWTGLRSISCWVNTFCKQNDIQ